MYRLFTFIPDSPGVGYTLEFTSELEESCHDFASEHEFLFYRIEYSMNGMTSIIFETQVEEL